MSYEKDLLLKVLKGQKLNKNIQNLQKIVDKDDGITSITISSGDTEVVFKKEKK